MESHQHSSNPGSSHKIEVVLGAGGIKGFGHIGLLKALEDSHIDIGEITGVSVGSIVAALYTNGYRPEELIDIFLASLKRRLDPFVLCRCFTFADPLSLAIGGWVDPAPLYREMVQSFKLKPNSNLRILSCDILRQHPVLFTGTNYDLALALTASCALPGVFRPVWYTKDSINHLLVDGAWYHYNPAEFSKDPAIISTFSAATRPPSEWQLPLDLYFHFREMYFPLAPHRRFVDATKHIVIETGLPDVAGLNFGLSRHKCLEIVDNAYHTTLQALETARSQGKLPCNN